ncbi:MAG: hydrolase 1, exosortase A system-associated [Burkholderiales bacterium]|nr:hydrolase 1, exosortase A system-associated [Burkholderiales bacterium]
MTVTSIAFFERASVFSCEGERAVAVSATPQVRFKRGVLIVVGGPQYRAGSHRQFTLLCRMLAAQGIAAMRFDYRGMGDSEGAPRTFEAVADDVRAAVDHFFGQHPDVREVALWGLCDAASAALFYARHDPRVTGLVLLNPWVRTAEGVARAYLKGYYAKRVLDTEFWGKMLRGQFSFVESSRSLVAHVAAAVRPRAPEPTGEPAQERQQGLPRRMLEAWHAFRGSILLILSGKDLTADEFRSLMAQDPEWKRAVAQPRVRLHEVADANHTFSRADWRAQVEQLTAQWVRSW